MEQWNFLSNLIQAYDLSHGIAFAEEFLREQSVLPLKFRFKYASVRQFLKDLSRKSSFILDENIDFGTLCSDDRMNLVTISRVPLTIFTTLIIVHQSRLLHQTGFVQSTENLFGSKLINLMEDFLDQLDFDLTLIKLIFFISLFSTVNRSQLVDVKALLQIQNKYIELAWKYFLNKSDYQQTVLAFIKLLDCLFVLMKIFEEFYQDKSLTLILRFIDKRTN